MTFKEENGSIYRFLLRFVSSIYNKKSNNTHKKDKNKTGNADRGNK